MTEVCITVDVEFSIGGAFADPDHNRPLGAEMVRCEIDGKSHGLGFVLKTLRDCELKATFFVEALNRDYFGDEPMRSVVEEILKQGHDVELHLHPCWRVFRNDLWRETVRSHPPDDSMAGRTVGESEELIQAGISTLEHWGAPRPVALRTGGLQVDTNVYTAMMGQGLRLGSNVALAVYRPAEPALHLYGGLHRVDGVIEAPVLTYCDLRIGFREHLKTLTITGSSWSEARSLLDAANRSQLTPVVILTHPFEFVKKGNAKMKGIVPNRVNQRRLLRLCKYLGENRERFEVLTFREGLHRWRNRKESRDLRLRVAPWVTLSRIVENRLNDRFAWY